MDKFSYPLNLVNGKSYVFRLEADIKSLEVFSSFFFPLTPVKYIGCRLNLYHNIFYETE